MSVTEWERVGGIGSTAVRWTRGAVEVRFECFTTTVGWEGVIEIAVTTDSAEETWRAIDSMGDSLKGLGSWSTGTLLSVAGRDAGVRFGMTGSLRCPAEVARVVWDGVRRGWR